MFISRSSPFVVHKIIINSTTYCYNRLSVSSSIRMADDVDYEAQFKKLEKEAEERLDDKVNELMSNIETVGQK